MNRLADETSPYLLQHAYNPVDWFPWGQEALAHAREEDKPILLSVGYAACHWCHVMAHESFEDEATATLMNEHFVPVKVDREERPDVDSVYMDAVVSLTGHGGLPLTVFLTPTGEPFFGGTYYPPEPRHGLPSFKQLLQAIAAAWRERRTDLERDAGAITEQLRRTAEPSREPLTSSLLADAVRGLRRQFDPVWGGFGNAPKFPPASAIEFLLRRGELEPATKTLDAMALGGMYDLVGGGFHRYSVDREWLVPHFEKMLYDNALLVPAYLHGWVVTGNERYREIAEETLEFMLGPLSTPAGRLFRTWRGGQAKHAGVLEDYADVANGLYELHVATGELRWLEETRRLALLAIELFADEERGGFFLTPGDGERLVVRKKDFDDHPTPSGNSMLAFVLLRLARLWGDAEP